MSFGEMYTCITSSDERDFPFALPEVAAYLGRTSRGENLQEVDLGGWFQRPDLKSFQPRFYLKATPRQLGGYQHRCGYARSCCVFEVTACEYDTKSCGYETEGASGSVIVCRRFESSER